MSELIILLLVFFAIGAAYVVFLTVFNRTSNHIRILSVDDFEKQLAATKDAIIIDVRTPREYNKYCIAGAINID